MKVVLFIAMEQGQLEKVRISRKNDSSSQCCDKLILEQDINEIRQHSFVFLAYCPLPTAYFLNYYNQYLFSNNVAQLICHYTSLSNYELRFTHDE